MTEQEKINAIRNIQGIDSMTVNERLYLSGLMDEFDRAKIHDKKKAKKILELLGVDEKSILQFI